MEGVPQARVIREGEIREALAEIVSVIIQAARFALEQMPPEPSADIIDRGIVLSARGSLWSGRSP